MAIFKYAAKNAEGKTVKGEVPAVDRIAAIASLKSQNLIPISVNEINSSEQKNWKDIEIFEPSIYDAKMKKKKLLAFLSQMAIMMKAGVSLPLAMEVLIGQETNRRTKKIVTAVNEDMLLGIPLSKSMAKFKAFPEIVTNMVSAGESNGRLDVSFDRASINLEKEIDLSGKIKNAMMYPAFLLFLVSILVIVLNIFILPVFSDMFKQLKTELPLITKIVMGISDFIRTRWYFVISVPVVFVIAFLFSYNKLKGFRYAIDSIKLRIPVFGRISALTLIARFCRMLSSLIDAGVEVVEALIIARGVISNSYMQSAIDKIVEDVKVGFPINKAMMKQKVLTPLLVSMIKVGEESGMLSEVLEKMAVLYEAETDNATKQLVVLMEPAMTVIIAGIVGVIVISIILPMFNMYSALRDFK